jgi:putative oxidoreductase
MKSFVAWLIDWPARVARHLVWLGPLAARITVGFVFMSTGWGKLNDLPRIVDLFKELMIPMPELMAPFVSAVEFGGGVLLLLGLLTRWAAAPLVVVMIVATLSAKLDQIDPTDTLFGKADTLLGFEEISYMAMFLWLAVAGPGKASLDYLLQRAVGSTDEVAGK